MKSVNKAGLQYRQAQAADAHCLMDICYSSYAEFERVLSAPQWKLMKQGLTDGAGFSELLSKSVAFVCCHEERIIAAAYLLPSGNPTSIFPADWSYIRLLGVLPDYRGLGIGRGLTECCIRHARAQGEHILALHTSEFHAAARQLYESLGFVQQREISPKFDKKYWIYTLSLQS